MCVFVCLFMFLFVVRLGGFFGVGIFPLSPFSTNISPASTHG